MYQGSSFFLSIRVDLAQGRQVLTFVRGTRNGLVGVIRFFHHKVHEAHKEVEWKDGVVYPGFSLWSTPSTCVFEVVFLPFRR